MLDENVVPTKNFPNDPRLADLPEEIRSKYRGRSVPSPLMEKDLSKIEVVEILIARTIVPIKIDLPDTGFTNLLFAASSWVVSRIAIKKTGGSATKIRLISSDELGSSVDKEFDLGSNLLLEDAGDINFVILKEETLSISPVDGGITMIGSIELVQEGGKITRTTKLVAPGPPA